MTLPKKFNSISSSRLEELYDKIDKVVSLKFARSYKINMLLPELKIEIDYYSERINETIAEVGDDYDYWQVETIKNKVNYYRLVLRDLKKERKKLEFLIENE